MPKSVDPEIQRLEGGSEVGCQIRWLGLSAGQDGVPISRPQYKSKTVQVTGELLDGDLEGTNDPRDPTSWMVVRDDENRRLTRPGFYHLKINPLFLRPVVRKGEHVGWDIVCNH